MSHPTASTVGRQRDRLANSPDLPFENLLTTEQIDQAIRDEKLYFRDRVYTPAVTIWAFLWQVLTPNGSCRDAVGRIIAWCVRTGRPVPAVDTGAYCDARGRLPLGLIQGLVTGVVDRVRGVASDEWRWCGHRVKVADGTTVSMPDTAANQEEFPQPKSQKKGIGFPIARVVVVFGLACGSAIGWATGRYRGKGQGETSLILDLLDQFEPGEVLLADRYYSGYGILARGFVRGVHYVGQSHAARRVDFRAGRRLGKGDHVVRWTKPATRAAGWEEGAWATLPSELHVREVRVSVRIAGFRTKTYVIVTTLLDQVAYPATALAELYRRRWLVELNLKSLKITLGMDVLRCKTPEMVRKEVAMHLLAYNLIRGVMAASAGAVGREAWEVSFTGAWSAVRSLEAVLCMDPSEGWLILLRVVGVQQVGNRPNRVEPRVKKRRPKPYRLMTRPRQELRDELTGVAP